MHRQSITQPLSKNGDVFAMCFPQCDFHNVVFAEGCVVST